MALTSWNDILNKPAALEQVDEIALEVSQLSSSVLTISGDITTINNTISSIPTDWSTQETIYDVTGVLVKGMINEKLGLAQISIRGSVTPPSQTSYEIEIDSKYLPIGAPFSICSNGAALYFHDTNNHLVISNVSTSHPWFAGYMIYSVNRPITTQTKKTTKKK